MEIPREQKEVVLPGIRSFQLDLLLTHEQILFLKEPFLQEMGIKTSLGATETTSCLAPMGFQKREIREGCEMVLELQWDGQEKQLRN